ncbi:pilus assembly FimT family protein [Microbacterium sp. CJ88]|uniref:pilus assembly FimT family protein n=1 Tax=Microbacterium sp. CJ88 TaxID=3445672 RepID=UPI003F65A41B
MISSRIPHDDHDSGLSLVELLITVLVAAVILGVVATVFFSTLQANAAARDRDLSTGRVQAISTSLSTSVRNAANVTVQSVSGGGLVARAAVASGTTAWTCTAWAVVDLSGRSSSGAVVNNPDGRFELRYATYAPLASSATSPAPSTSWSVMAERIEPIRNSAGNVQAYFVASTDSKQLTWNLSVSTAEQPQASSGSLAALTGSAAAKSFVSGSQPRC